jgi:hypothetical protein
MKKKELDAEDWAMIERVRERAGSRYDLLLEWQSLILAGQPKPEGLSEFDSSYYDLLKNQLDAAGRLGYVIDIPDGGPSHEPPPTEPLPTEALVPVYTAEPMPLLDFSEEYLRGVLGLTDEEILELRRKYRGDRTYIIVARSGRSLLLAHNIAPLSPARIWSPADGLSPIRTAANLMKFGIWEPYDGPQDALEGIVPDDCIPPGTVPPELQRPREEPPPEVQRPMEEPPREPKPTYPNTDVMTRWLKDIVLGAEKPDGLSPHESAAWDRLAADVAADRERGYIIEIPAE